MQTVATRNHSLRWVITSTRTIPLLLKKIQESLNNLQKTLDQHESRARCHTHRSGHDIHHVAGRSQEVEEEEAGNMELHKPYEIFSNCSKIFHGIPRKKVWNFF